MVDPNPARGMPIQLQKYWLGGKGAAKIRWGMPHDFNRCVRQLRKHFPANPEGLCNILHTRALGAPPGKGHGHSITFSQVVGIYDQESLVAAQALMDQQPRLGHVWAGPLALLNRPTEEPRRIRILNEHGMRHRALPLPLDHRVYGGVPGHTGSITVARMLGIAHGPDHTGEMFTWAWGDWLDEEIVPEVTRARYLVEQGVAGASVDPGGSMAVQVDPKTGAENVLSFTIGGATLVSIPAFSGTRLYSFGEGSDWPDDDPDMVAELEPAASSDCGCGDTATAALGADDSFAVNPSGWRGLPLAPRDAVFDNDDALKRIAAWASITAQGADVDKLRRAFLWYNTEQPPTVTTSYRLPVGDVINGELTMVYHAIYAAAALLSGAHGGLPDISEPDRQALRNTISEIYPEMSKTFNDSSIRAPWDRSAQEGVQLSVDDFYEDDENPADVEAAFAAGEKGITMEPTQYPVKPPRAWFEKPELGAKTPLTVTNEGQVFGHIAAWGECHRDFASRNECVLAPKSKQGYAPFHLGSVYTAEGDTIQVGKIVMDTRHADIGLGYTAAAVHYDHTGDEAAIVRASDGQFGIWVAGAVVPEASATKVAKLRRSPISGDWRRHDGNLELTAALAVNVPAFPVYAMEDGEQMSLVAAGTLEPVPLCTDPAPHGMGHVHDVPTGIDPNAAPVEALTASQMAREVLAEMARMQEAEERAERIRDLQEDEGIYAQRTREARFEALVDQ